jgi:glutaredoxin
VIEVGDMTTSNVRAPLKVYWQPGCSSCLRTKEFLIANGVEFESINVLEDEKGFQELEALGVRLVPIVARGKDWANGAVFRDVARVAGFEWGGHEMLAPAEMVARINVILIVPSARLSHLSDPRGVSEPRGAQRTLYL